MFSPRMTDPAALTVSPPAVSPFNSMRRTALIPALNAFVLGLDTRLACSR